MPNFVIVIGWVIPGKGASRIKLVRTFGRSWSVRSNKRSSVATDTEISLLENWKRRIEIVEYCTGVVDHFVEAEQQSFESQPQDDPARNRRAQAAMFANEVKASGFGSTMENLSTNGDIQRNQVHNEKTIEKIVRQKSLDGKGLTSRNRSSHSYTFL